MAASTMSFARMVAGHGRIASSRVSRGLAVSAGATTTSAARVHGSTISRNLETPQTQQRRFLSGIPSGSQKILGGLPRSTWGRSSLGRSQPSQQQQQSRSFASAGGSNPWTSSFTRVGRLERWLLLAILGGIGYYYSVKKFDDKPGIAPDLADKYSQVVKYELEYQDLREKLDQMLHEEGFAEDEEERVVLRKKMKAQVARVHRVLYHRLLETFQEVLDESRNLVGPLNYRLLTPLRKLAFQKRRLVQFQLQYQSLLRAEDKLSKKELQQNLDEVEAHYTEMIEVAKKEFGPNHRQVVYASLDLASFFFELDDHENAQKILKNAWERLQEFKESKYPLQDRIKKLILQQDEATLDRAAEGQVSQLLSETFRFQNKLREAVDWSGVALQVLEDLHGASDWQVALILTRISALLVQSGRNAEAEATARRSLHLAERYFPDSSTADILQQPQLFLPRSDAPTMQLKLAAMANLGRILAKKREDDEAFREGKQLLREARRIAKEAGDTLSQPQIEEMIKDAGVRL